ncbi:hypothetical protein R1sor_008849 [Riccia sorocarpa]|uniref:Uncharacterized protein n=1 Tax=Riccia sorocarpa TaxID=122646 RepID=A0ABD3H7D5_9MARC
MQMTLIRRTLRKEKVSDIGSWADWAERKNKCRPLTLADDTSVEFGLQGQNLAPSFILAATLKVIWQERNEMTYSAKRTRVPVPILLCRAKEMLEAIRKKADSEAKELHFAVAITSTQTAIDRFVNASDGPANTTPQLTNSAQTDLDEDNNTAMSESEEISSTDLDPDHEQEIIQEAATHTITRSPLDDELLLCFEEEHQWSVIRPVNQQQ